MRDRCILSGECLLLSLLLSRSVDMKRRGEGIHVLHSVTDTADTLIQNLFQLLLSVPSSSAFYVLQVPKAVFPTLPCSYDSRCNLNSANQVHLPELNMKGGNYCADEDSGRVGVSHKLSAC